MLGPMTLVVACFSRSRLIMSFIMVKSALLLCSLGTRSATKGC